ncbi:MAG: Maf family protein [Eubacteriales bacterium]|nr:Maf family protein [Eubacteriales bacterium]
MMLPFRHRPVILASQSPRRRELLARIVPQFTVSPADVDESLSPGCTPKENVKQLAQRKARAAAEQADGDALVIAADTIVVCDDIILGKPADQADAVRMLRMLSGRTHQVMTAVCVKTADRELADVSVTDVTFRALRDGEAEAYAASGEPMDKAGAYGIQGQGSLFISGINGDYYGVMGLPVCMLHDMLWEICGGKNAETQKG